MNNWAQRKAIAEYRGWLDIKETGRLDGQLVGFPPGGKLGQRVELPDWPGDLNEMHSLEMWAFPNEVPQGFYHPLADDYENNLKIACGYTATLFNGWALLTPTAGQRCEAFLRTIGKWDDELARP